MSGAPLPLCMDRQLLYNEHAKHYTRSDPECVARGYESAIGGKSTMECSHRTKLRLKEDGIRRNFTPVNDGGSCINSSGKSASRAPVKQTWDQGSSKSDAFELVDIDQSDLAPGSRNT